MKPVSVFVLALTASAAVAAPQQIAVGDPRVSGIRLKPYENAWLYTARFPDGHVKTQGIWSDHVELIAVEGRQALKRVQGMTYVNALSSSGITVMDAKTCAPISTEQHRPDGLLIKRVFNGGHVVTERTNHPGDAAKQTVVDLPSPVFDYYGGAYGFLISCFPLKVGYSATFPAIGETEDVDDPVKFTVVKQQRIRAGSRGLVETFVVTSEKPGEYTQTYWLSPEPPYIIRLEIRYPDKPYVASFDMI
jgi:hypothetical protein